jgi:hypothetical protein
VRDEWPYTGSLLAEIAEDWEDSAKFADVHAEQLRIRFQE